MESAIENNVWNGTANSSCGHYCAVWCLNKHYNFIVKQFITTVHRVFILCSTYWSLQWRKITIFAHRLRVSAALLTHWGWHNASWASCQISKIAGCACAGIAGNVFPTSRVSDPDMQHDTWVTHVSWCMPGSLTSGFLWSRWRGKRSRHSRCMHNRQFYVHVSGKRPMGAGNCDEDMWKVRSNLLDVDFIRGHIDRHCKKYLYR